MRSSNEMYRHPPTHSASASVSSSGALDSMGTSSTVAVLPMSVPTKRNSALERTAPASGCATT